MVEKIKAVLLQKTLYLTEEQTIDLKRAISFAEEAHFGQKRATGEPYIIHPLIVCDILLEYQADITTLISALLHDVVEDTSVTVNEIHKTFGSQVAFIVDGLTKVEKGSFNKEEYSAINKEKLLCTSVKDIRVAVIKIADRLHNMRTLSVKRVEKKVPYANETLIFFSPLAERLGLSKMQEELEELAFSYMNPPKYKWFKKVIDNYTSLFLNIYNQCLEDVDSSCNNLPKIRVDWGKTPIYKLDSLLQEGYPISDMFTIKFITDSPINCYTALGTIHRLYKPIEQKFQDNLAIQKNPFIKFLSTKVTINDVEVQINIQTETEEKNKNLGVFSLIKGNLSSDEVMKLSTTLLRDTINNVKTISNNSIQFYDLISYELLQRDITVLTPKLDVFLLPKGSTVIDFAFTLDPELARRMEKVKINGRIMPINTILTDMDIVDLYISDFEMVNSDWLNFVQTSKAHKEINELLYKKGV